MAFVIIIALIVAGIGLLVAGLFTGSAALFLGAALCSALAVVVLWQSVRVRTMKTFVTDVPVPPAPTWDEPLPSDAVAEDDDQPSSRETLPPVAIDGYEDLVASEIMPSLETLSIEELEQVINRERRGLGRPVIIARAERLIDLTRGTVNPALDLRQEDAGRRPRSHDGLSLE